MKVKIGWMLVPVLLLALLAVGVLPGCEVGSPNSVVAGANGNFSGTYIGGSNGLMVANNSGAMVESLILSQTGNQLQAVDNNGMLFKGTIGDILSPSGNTADGSASYVLSGVTTVGAAVNLSGTLSGSGTTATMVGVWVEPDRTCGFYGIAGIAPIIPGGTLYIDPNPVVVHIASGPVTLTAKNGTAPYTWNVRPGGTPYTQISNTNGNISASSGESVVYTRILAGDNSVTVVDAAGHSATTYIQQP